MVKKKNTKKNVLTKKWVLTKKNKNKPVLRRRNISFKFHQKIKKWTTKAIMFDIFLTLFFLCCMVHWIFEVFHSFKEWTSILLFWLLFLLIIEVLLFTESVKILHSNLLIYVKNKKKEKGMKKKGNKGENGK